MTPEQGLAKLQAGKVQRVPLAEITADPALQPRQLKAVWYGDRNAVKKASGDHVTGLLCHLQANGKNQLPPILLAKVGKRLLVVDGFHRTAAYKAADRTSIPARIATLPYKVAVMAAKLANLDNRALPLDKGQRLEVCWQWLAQVTTITGGETTPPTSVRQLHQRWNVNRRTLASMLRLLPAVQRKANAGDWESRDCDPGTGLPFWNAVKRWLAEQHRPHKEENTMCDKDRERGERLTGKLVALLSNSSPQVARYALQRTVEELEQAATDNADTDGMLDSLRDAWRVMRLVPDARDAEDDPY